MFWETLVGTEVWISFQRGEWLLNHSSSLSCINIFFPTVHGAMTTWGKISGQKQPCYSYQYIYTDSLLLIEMNLILLATEFAPCACHRQTSILEEIAIYLQFSSVGQTVEFTEMFCSMFVFLNGSHIRHNVEWQGIMRLLRWYIWWFFKERSPRDGPPEHSFGFGHSIT